MASAGTELTNPARTQLVDALLLYQGKALDTLAQSAVAALPARRDLVGAT